MRIPEGSLLTEYIGYYCVIDTNKISSGFEFIKDQLFKIIEFDPNNTHGPLFKLDIVDKTALPSNVKQALTNGFFFWGKSDEIEVSEYKEGDAITNGRKTYTIDGVYSYDGVNGFYYKTVNNCNFSSTHFKLHSFVKTPANAFIGVDVAVGEICDVVGEKGVVPFEDLSKYEQQIVCNHPHDKRYKNIITKAMKFWSCGRCGADLGDINE